jgi:hypothetical protein
MGSHLALAYLGLSDEGETLLQLVAGSALLVGFAFSLARWRQLARAFLYTVGPIAAIIAYNVINPDPGCTYDCPGKAGWLVILLPAAAAWIAGCFLGMVAGAGLRRFRTVREQGP